jgi:hypothetical protein
MVVRRRGLAAARPVRPVESAEPVQAVQAVQAVHVLDDDGCELIMPGRPDLVREAPVEIGEATGIVTTAASQAVPLTAVPMVSTTLPVTASPRCAMALSRLVPPNDANTRVAKPPNTANGAICGSPMTLKVSANRDGITIVARSARIAAGTDHTGRQTAWRDTPGGRRRSQWREGTATAESGTNQAHKTAR